jgi:UDP-glucuronate decarboxylase
MDSVEMKRVLVTGGAGFIGSHLCECLLEAGCDVICLDNMFTGRRENVEFLQEYAKKTAGSFEFCRHDITEPLLLEVDYIYHFACPASPVHYQHNPVKTIKTNVMGTINMLGLAKRVGARILLASTSEVYGNPLEHPQTESYWGNVNPIGIRSCYDEGKRVAETLTMDYQRQNGVDAKIIRIFNTYGPRMLFDDGRVVSNFIVQALKGNPLTVYGEGSQTRSFCYVDDLVQGILAMMDKADFVGPVNLGNPHEVTVLELAEAVLKLTGSKSTIENRPLPADDPSRRKPDISLAKAQLGWEPNIGFEEGLQKTIEEFKSRLQ